MQTLPENKIVAGVVFRSTGRIAALSPQSGQVVSVDFVKDQLTKMLKAMSTGDLHVAHRHVLSQAEGDIIGDLIDFGTIQDTRQLVLLPLEGLDMPQGIGIAELEKLHREGFEFGLNLVKQFPQYLIALKTLFSEYSNILDWALSAGGFGIDYGYLNDLAIVLGVDLMGRLRGFEPAEGMDFLEYVVFQQAVAHAIKEIDRATFQKFVLTNRLVDLVMATSENERENILRTMFRVAHQLAMVSHLVDTSRQETGMSGIGAYTQFISDFYRVVSSHNVTSQTCTPPDEIFSLRNGVLGELFEESVQPYRDFGYMPDVDNYDEVMVWMGLDLESEAVNLRMTHFASSRESDVAFHLYGQGWNINLDHMEDEVRKEQKQATLAKSRLWARRLGLTDGEYAFTPEGGYTSKKFDVEVSFWESSDTSGKRSLNRYLWMIKTIRRYLVSDLNQFENVLAEEIIQAMGW